MMRLNFVINMPDLQMARWTSSRSEKSVGETIDGLILGNSFKVCITSWFFSVVRNAIPLKVYLNSFHIHVVHWINTISWNNVTESTLHEEVHLDFPLWSNPDVHTMIFLKYMDRLFSKYMDRQYKRNTLIFALQRAAGISCWYQVVLMQGARPLLPPRMF